MSNSDLRNVIVVNMVFFPSSISFQGWIPVRQAERQTLVSGHINFD